MSILDSAELPIKTPGGGAESAAPAAQIPVERDLRPSCFDDFRCLAADCPLPREKYRMVTPKEWLAVSFRDIRSQCIDFLQDRRFTLPQRVLLMGLALKELTNGETDVARWLDRAQALAELPGITSHLQEAEPARPCRCS